MDKKKYIKRGIGILCTAMIIAITLLIILNVAIYDSLKSNLEEKLVEADKQRVFALEKQFSVFSTTMGGISSSIKQMAKDGIRKNEVKLRILLADLCTDLDMTVLGICDENGKGIVGTDIDFENQLGIKESFETGKSTISFVEKGSQGEQECLMFTIPIKDNKDECFVLYATIARELISNVFNASTTYANQNIMVVQSKDTSDEGASGEVVLPMKDGIIQFKIMDHISKMLNNDFSGTDFYKEFGKKVAKNGSTIVRMDIDGYSEQYISVVKLENMPWYLVTAVPTSETDEYINDATIRVILLFAIMLFLFIGIIVLIMYLQYRSQSQIFNLAYYDSKTGIYNWEYMQIKMAEDEKKYKDMTMVIFDVRGLKYINELYGYNEGDRVILGIAEYLRKNTIIDYKDNLYCKLNDDSFAVVVGIDLNDKLIKNVKKYVADIRKKISDTFEVKIYAALAPVEKNDNGNYQITLDNAFAAMDTIKKKREFSIGVYDQELRDVEIRNKKLEGDLQEAIRDKDLIVYYQPKFDAKTEKLVGAEALIRWKHKELGFLPPGLFIPLFENNGMIGIIDMYVFEEVCRYIKELKHKGVKVPVMSVNLSRAEINDRNLVKRIKKLRKKYDVDPDLIEIEITESSMNSNENMLIEISEELHKAGFGLAIDDFGTGYSSFAQLIEMPLDTIKLDKSFLDSYAVEGRGSNVHVFICDVIQIAKHIECKVVAEGVETKEQRDMLAEAECDIIQGYYYGKPMSMQDFNKLIQEA